MAEQTWKKMLEAEARRKGRPVPIDFDSSGNPIYEGDKPTIPTPPSTPAAAPSPPLPADPVMERMAADLAFIRRKQAIDLYAPGIALLILIGLVVLILGRPFG